SPIPLERALTHTLLERYRGFLEGDARHSIWLHSPAEESTLVYDRHDLIFAYGPLDRFADALRSRSFSEREVRVPTPHSHHYHPQFDASERAILEHLEWRRSPLQPSDEEE
ncbi:MAG: hypothetical protein JST92_21195, partial [Deltaproteobacteria bacterium]|nr:hypothetical protein [Deltaproteobacteria bacterium]